MDFDIVIATRNRQEVLRLSLPLMLSQSRLPARLIIVDSSDDLLSTRQVAETAVRATGAGTELQIHTSRAGTSMQRNKGLKYVASPVVFFPDDDSLWFPNLTETIMEIYEKDGGGWIGGVRGEESFTPPTELPGGGGRPYEMARRDRMQLRIGHLQYRMEKRFFPDPLFAEATVRYRNIAWPHWLDEAGAVPSGPMFGFSMSFRTDAIRHKGFDETLGRYALFEDLDASLSVLEHQVLACARPARVFHFRAPERRVNGREWGMMHILNRTYVLCKHSPPGSHARRLHNRFMYYKLARYLLQCTSSYGRERLTGAWRAMLRTPHLLNARKAELPGQYLRLREGCLAGQA